MSSHYSITSADIVPDLIPSGEYASLIRDRVEGAAALDFDDLVLACEAEFHSHLGGTPSTATVKALCKPQVLNMVVYRLYCRKYQQPEGKLNEGVLEGYRNAIAWAKTTGAKLLAGEGSDAAGQGNVEYSSPDEHYSMTQLDGI